jgi:uncharacterized protein
MIKAKDANLDVEEPAVAFNLNRTYRMGMPAKELYECTRGIWRVNLSRAERTRYAFAVYQGVVVEVFVPKRWHSAGMTPYQFRRFLAWELKGRLEFEGDIAPSEIRQKYLGRRIPPHSQNPVRYFNC